MKLGCGGSLFFPFPQLHFVETVLSACSVPKVHEATWKLDGSAEEKQMTGTSWMEMLLSMPCSFLSQFARVVALSPARMAMKRDPLASELLANTWNMMKFC